MIDFNKVITSQGQSLNEKVESILNLYPNYFREHSRPIKWIQFELSEETFRKFALDKLSRSMAYNSEIMKLPEAELYIDRFIDNFAENRKFFTNWYDVELRLEKANGWDPVTEHTYDCCLLCTDDTNTGAIILIDED